MNPMRRRIILLSIIALAAMAVFACAKFGKGSFSGLTIVAPDYLQGAIETVAGQFENENKTHVRVIYAPSDKVLARAGESAADLFVIGDAERNDCREALDSIVGDGPYSCPFRLSLIVAGRQGGPVCDDTRGLADDAFHRVVMVDTLRYEGMLAREALERARVWKKIRDKLILAPTSRELASYVQSGEADAALALEVSLRGETGWTFLARLDDDRRVYKRLLHCAGVTAAASDKNAARALLDLFDSRLCPLYRLPGIAQNTED